MPYPEFAARLLDVRQRIAEAAARGGQSKGVTIIAVTKTHGADAVRASWDAGVHDCGENKVQEAVGKMAGLDVPVRWHLVGHLQRNKVKQTGEFALIHSMDSARLADSLHAAGIARGRAVDVLMQLNVAGEETKGGYGPDDVLPEAERLMSLEGLRVRGVMTMAPFGAAEGVLRSVFGGARDALAVLATAGHPATELSMGMSDDYETAVEEGATMVRLGTVLFGARPA